MPVGKLRKYDWDRGFGFISNDLDGGEIFVHVKQFDRSGIHDPQLGDVFEYAVGVFNGRDEAVSIARISRVEDMKDCASNH
jgi:cold shock CspA family protein